MNPALIRVVTAHLGEMQGLRRVAMGVGLALFAVVGSLPHADPIDGLIYGSAYLVPLAFFVWSSYAVPEYYERRTGHVVCTPAARMSSLAFAFWGVWPMVLVPARGWGQAIWLVWTMYPLYVTWSGWPYRAHHLISFAGALYVFRLQLIAPAPMPGSWIHQTCVLATVLIVTGLADHAVLVRAMPMNQDAAVPDEV